MNYLSRSPFYKEFIKNEISLEIFPVINKEIFMKNFDQINTCGLKKTDALDLALKAENNRDFSETLNGITVGLSTGTSGNIGIFLANERERAKWVAAVLHRVIGFQLNPRKIAFFLRSNSKLYESVNSSFLNLHFFDLLNSNESNFQRLMDLNADILVAQPSALLNIAALYIKSGKKHAYKKIISVAEVLEIADRNYLEGVFSLKIDEVYQCTEGFLASTCKYGKLHLNEDFLIIEKEYLDPEKRRYNPIITDLYRRTQPVIRYKLDDILIEGEDCKCGNKFAVIDQIEGRMDDIIKIIDRSGKLTDIYPDYLRRAISLSSDVIMDYAITQTGKNILEIYIHGIPALEKKSIETKIKENISDLLSKFNIEQPEIRFTEFNNQDQGTKLRRIKNEYFKKI